MAARKKPKTSGVDAADLAAKLRRGSRTRRTAPVPHDEITRLCLELEKAVLPLLEAFSAFRGDRTSASNARTSTKAGQKRGLKRHLDEGQIAAIPFFLKCYSRLGIVVRQIGSDVGFGTSPHIAQNALRVLIDQSCRNVASIHKTRAERLRVFASLRFQFPVLSAYPVVARTLDGTFRKISVGTAHVGADGHSRAKYDKFREAAEDFTVSVNLHLEEYYGFSLFELRELAPAERDEIWALLSSKLRKKALPDFLATEATHDLKSSLRKRPSSRKAPPPTWQSVLLPLVSKTVLLPSRRRDRMKEVILDRMKTALGLNDLKH